MVGREVGRIVRHPEVRLLHDTGGDSRCRNRFLVDECPSNDDAQSHFGPDHCDGRRPFSIAHGMNSPGANGSRYSVSMRSSAMWLTRSAVNRPSRTASHSRARVRLQESPARCAALWATESSSTASAGIAAATANTAVSPSFRPSDMSCAANPPNAESSSSVRSSWCSIHVAWSTALWRARGLLPFGASKATCTGMMARLEPTNDLSAPSQPARASAPAGRCRTRRRPYCETGDARLGHERPNSVSGQQGEGRAGPPLPKCPAEAPGRGRQRSLRGDTG